MPFPALDRLAQRCELAVRERDGLMTTDEIVAFARGADGLLCMLADPVGDDVLGALAPPLRVVANYAVGVDNVDRAAAARRGVIVANTPGVLSAATAEIAMALLLALSRRIVEGDAFVRRGEFRGWEPTLLLGRGLDGKRLGVFGYGRIGREVARRALGFGLEVVATSRRSVPGDRDGEVRFVAFDELVDASDAISLHAPLTAETRGVFSASVLGRMKRGAFFVNTARGPLVDERALAERLRSGALSGAGFDVYDGEPRIDPELMSAPGTVLLPHVGSGTVETRGRMADLAVDALLAVLVDGRRPPNEVAPA